MYDWTEEELEAAWELLDDGQPDDVLSHLAELEAQGRPHPEAAALACLAWIDLREPDKAERSLGAQPADVPESWRLARAELFLAQWRPADARNVYRELEEEGASVQTRLRLALCEDLLGNEREAREWTHKAAAIDPDGAGTYPRLEDDEFEEVVAEAIALLPEKFAARLEEIPVIVDPVPTKPADGPADVPPDALGLFTGYSDAEKPIDGSPDDVATIHLYKNNLERRARSLRELREEIRVTIYHELGHVLGFDEKGVDAMGLR
jgi:predicted Zn-dependent protease with MMP-like domain